ncbi:holliday junction resolvase YEN1 [Alternaria panax]|uniref:Holliday junction resolvase YEN1 n=1 Tax=Alternaria panax TaxID=48097 RepID=A0AAD4IAH3_9PLEO|nr:holliday junction resolvase YEN1 [Alternaria panax]
MGLTALWDTIKKHEASVPVAQLAEEHHQQHGRPLRIAVDEADWRFNNLTVQQVYTIRETSNEYAFQGIEKAMFYRICRLLTLNIQLIFVFDGPGRPWKRGKRGGGRINYEEQRLLKEMLQYFGIPYHEAPGEAEAECARLQILGLVDAVWSQDSDCIMFGCTLWLRDHRIAKEKGTTDRSKENTKKNGEYANVVRACDLEEKYGLDRGGLVLFAMLVGGDYDVKGLPQCGPSLALQAVKQGLGRRLIACRDQADCGFWVVELAMFLERSARGRSIDIPSGFPDFKTLQKYYKPKVTSDEDLLKTSRLNLDYVSPIQELKLLTLTSERFNIWGRLYMNWVGPVLLTRCLTTRDSSLPLEIVHHIKLTKQRAKQTDNEPPMRTFERKLTFSPFGVTSLGRADFEGDRLGHWNGDKETMFDPNHRVECEFPEYWLRKVLPPDILDPPPPAPKRTPKCKRPTDEFEEELGVSSTAKRRRQNKRDNIPAGRAPRGCTARKSKGPASVVRSRNMPLTPTAQNILQCIELSESDDEGELSLPTNPRPKELPPNQVQASHIIDLGSPEPSDQESDLLVSDAYRDPTANVWPLDMSDEENEELQLALRLSMQDQGVMIAPTHGPSGSSSSSRASPSVNERRKIVMALLHQHPSNAAHDPTHYQLQLGPWSINELFPRQSECFSTTRALNRRSYIHAFQLRMDSIPIVYEDVVERVLNVATPMEAPKDEPICFVCHREYGSVGSGMETHLDFLSQLPGAYRKTFAEQTVKATRTPCGHIFCLFCLSAWFKRMRACSCPLCRKPMEIPFLFEVENTDDGLLNVGYRGLSLALHVSTPSAQETYRILNLQTRELLTTIETMPFEWNTRALVHDLPIFMVTIARRFYYQSMRSEEGSRVPKDLTYMKRHNPVDLVRVEPRFDDLKSLARFDTPLAKHEDALKLYRLLYDGIEDLKSSIGDEHGRCSDWKGPARMLMYNSVQEKMPGGNGGVSQRRWWAYVECVIKAVFVWQAYCYRVRTLVFQRIGQMNIAAAGVEEGVQAYMIG